MSAEKKNAKMGAVAWSVLVLLLVLLVIMMIVQISRLQGTARVINYAGLVRGATQREVKLEIAEKQNDDLISYLDEILYGLKYGDGTYHLVSLADDAYQKQLDIQMDYWDKLKDEIQKVRSLGYESTKIVDMSEEYFKIADETVAQAENYSEGVAKRIRYIEVISAGVMVLLVLFVIAKSIEAVRINARNKALEQEAYIDKHTGLPNKGRCEAFFNSNIFLQKPTACIVFDLNNLKQANDTLGYSVGDQLIVNFARLLRNAIPSQQFVGRYGGDEFMVVLTDTDEEELTALMAKLKDDVDAFNQMHHGNGSYVAVKYAYGYALSSDYKECTFRTLFDIADQNMYQNKLKSKRIAENSENE